jgi:Chaperone of endosialidase
MNALAPVQTVRKNSAKIDLIRLLLRHGLALIPLALVCFVVSPPARGQLPSPAPDGGYPGNNTAEGTDALFNVTDGVNNTAVGFKALFHNTRGNDNTATGYLALRNNRDGEANTADGDFALFTNTTGSKNTATGLSALANNTTAGDNTADGFDALFSNTTGIGNTATGSAALTSNTIGGGNTADGIGALRTNTSGSSNVAMGNNPLFSNTVGQDNVAIGSSALFSNTTGVDNTAVGQGALGFNDSGSFNIALGIAAGGRLTKGDNNIDIGNSGKAGDAETIRIGTNNRQKNTYIAGISGVTVAGGAEVIIDSSGHLGTVQSSARFKDDIKPMDQASEAVLKLKPVTFRYKEELDPDGIPQFGLIAEEVEKINPDLVVRDEEGKVTTVRYEAVNAMLLNEFLKEHRKVEEQRQEFEAKLAQQQKQIEALTVGLQKVTAEVKTAQANATRVADGQ